MSGLSRSARWVAEGGEGLPQPAVEGVEIRLVTCVECGRRAANPPSSLTQCPCGGQTVEHSIERTDYAELRVRGEVSR